MIIATKYPIFLAVMFYISTVLYIKKNYLSLLLFHFETPLFSFQIQNLSLSLWPLLSPKCSNFRFKRIDGCFNIAPRFALWPFRFKVWNLKPPSQPSSPPLPDMSSLSPTQPPLLFRTISNSKWFISPISLWFIPLFEFMTMCLFDVWICCFQLRFRVLGLMRVESFELPLLCKKGIPDCSANECCGLSPVNEMTIHV